MKKAKVETLHKEVCGGKNRLTAARVADIAVRTGCEGYLVAGALVLDAVARANPVALVKGFSILLAAIVLPSGADFDTEEGIAAFEVTFRLVSVQAFVANVIRMGQFLFIFPTGFVVAVKQLVHLWAPFRWRFMLPYHPSVQ
jgi:hypothetical protein